MTTTPIFLLAPAPGMAFVAMPSGATYAADENALIAIASGDVADQLALVAAGCVTLEPNAGGIVVPQTGTAYTVAPGDNGNNLVFSNASPVTVTLPNTVPAGFTVSLYQAGAGQVTAQPATGASVVTPNVATTPGPYCALFCIVVANGGGHAAQWAVIAQPSQTGGGLIGAATLASLYAQDTSAHYGQYSVAQIFSDPTSANSGFWLKTGTGNGSGNWTQQSTITLASLNAAIATETGTRIAAAAAMLATRGIWKGRKSPWAIAFTDGGGNILDGSVYLSGVRYTSNPFALSTGPLWAGRKWNLLAITDPNGDLLYAQDKSGDIYPPPVLNPNDQAALNLSRVTLGNFWSRTYGFAITDGSDNVMLGIRHNGTVDIGQLNPGTSGWLPVTNSVDGGLWAANGATQFKIATPQGVTAILNPTWLGGRQVQWFDSNVSPWELREFFFDGTTEVPVGVSTLLHFPLYGESTSVGTDAPTLYTTSPVNASKAFMYNAGTRTVPGTNFNNSNINAKAPDSEQVSLVPLREVLAGGFGETQLSGSAEQILALGSLPSTSGILGSCHGMGGATIGQLVQGSAQYDNLLRAVERGYALAQSSGRSFSVPAVLYIQGINDHANPEGTYDTALLLLQQNLANDINARTGGGSAQVPLIVVQYACWTASALGSGTAAPPNVQGFLDSYLANPTRIILVGNSYHLPWFAADGVHMLAQGYRMQGEEIGRVISGLLAGSTPAPLYATGATGVGMALTITFNAATQLAIDTSIVSDPGQSGLTLQDHLGNDIALSSIAVSGTKQITATTTSSLTSGATYTVGIANVGTAGINAGPTTGARAPIRDSAPESYSMGGRMYRYTCTQTLSFVAT